MVRVLTVSCVMLAAAAIGLADEVQFKNGDRVTGKIEKLDGDTLIITSAVAGEIKVKMADVKTFSTDGPIHIQMADGTAINQKVVAAPDAGKFALDKGGALAPQTLALADIKKVNPTAPTWTGTVNLGLLLTRGNTDTDNFNLALSLERRGENDRIGFDAAYLYGRQRNPDNDVKNTTVDNWFAQGKYDYFFAPKWYVYGQARVEKDRIAELDLRLMAGGGVGYQWVETETLKFNTEAGLTWFYESFANATPNNDSIAIRLAYGVEWKANDTVVVFHNLQFFPSLEDGGDYFLTTEAGVRASLTKSMFTELKVQADYDSTPALDASRANVRWVASVGWRF